MSTSMSRVRRQLMSWGTGAPVGGATGPTVLLADPSHLDAVLASGVAGPDGVVLVPGPVDDTTDPRVTGYDGVPDEPGAELAVGDDFFLQLQDYASAAFMALLGPTLVGVTNADDFELFLRDADTARAEGVFADFAVAPPVRLANLPGLGARPLTDGPHRRLYVAHDGAISTAPTGRAIGRAGDPAEALAREWDRINDADPAPCGVCLGGVLDDTDRVAGLAARPWLHRYHAALDAQRTMHANGLTGLRVSGFGGRLVPDLDAHPRADRPGPLVLWNDGAAFVFDPDTGRTFRFGARAARLAEALLVCGSVPAAGEVVGSDDELRAVAAFLDRAGVTVGEPALVGSGRAS